MPTLLNRIVQAEAKPPDQLVVCESCAHALADLACKTIVMGLHSHQVALESGHVLRFDCFSDAPGLVPDNSTTVEGTVFPEYRCVPAHCAQCDEQLGWFFVGPKPFFGILADRTTRIRRTDRR
ncbi:MAG: hypothetical protein J4F97_05165 [Pseudomonadales bacterium]|nr:hypothetical protein [Pseudomonadales bacterium]